MSPLPASRAGRSRRLLPSIVLAVLLLPLVSGTSPPPASHLAAATPASAPVLYKFLVTPANVTLGNSVQFVTAASGGTGPLSYAYRSLPPGCVSENTTLLSCTPTATGVFPVVVTVSDATGANVSGAAVLVVLPAAPPPPASSPLVLLAFLVYPTSVELGNLTVFIAAVTGGVAPLSYSYGSLPPGCLPLPLPVVPCRPSAAGSYTVSVTVVDANGSAAHGETALAVVSPVSASPTPSASGTSTTELWEYAAGGAVAGAGAMALIALLFARWRQVRRP